MIEIEIYWNDLSEAKRKEIQEELKMEANDNANWDVFPIAILSFEKED